MNFDTIGQDIQSQIIPHLTGKDIRSLMMTSSSFRKLYDSEEFWRLYFKNDPTTNESHRLALAKNLLLGSRLYYYDKISKEQKVMQYYMDHKGKKHSLGYISKIREYEDWVVLYTVDNKTFLKDIGKQDFVLYSTNDWYACTPYVFIRDNEVLALNRMIWGSNTATIIKYSLPEKIQYAQISNDYLYVLTEECNINIYNINEYSYPQTVSKLKRKNTPFYLNYKMEYIVNAELTEKKNLIKVIPLNGKIPIFMEAGLVSKTNNKGIGYYPIYIGLYPNTLLTIKELEIEQKEYHSTPVDINMSFIFLENGDIIERDNIVRQDALAVMGEIITYITKDYKGNTVIPQDTLDDDTLLDSFNEKYILYNGWTDYLKNIHTLFYLQPNL